MTLGSFLFSISSNYKIIILMIFMIGVEIIVIQRADDPFIRELDKP